MRPGIQVDSRLPEDRASRLTSFSTSLGESLSQHARRTRSSCRPKTASVSMRRSYGRWISTLPRRRSFSERTDDHAKCGDGRASEALRDQRPRAFETEQKSRLWGSHPISLSVPRNKLKCPDEGPYIAGRPMSRSTQGKFKEQQFCNHESLLASKYLPLASVILQSPMTASRGSHSYVRLTTPRSAPLHRSARMFTVRSTCAHQLGFDSPQMDPRAVTVPYQLESALVPRGSDA